MKLIKIIVLSGVLTAGLASCDFLDKDPHSLALENYFNTAEELQSFLTGVYSPLMQEQFYGNNYALYNAGGDDLTFYQRSSPAESILCANANSANPNISAFWRLLYEGVNRANMLLEGADNNPDLPKTVRDQAKAQALFLRAFYYFHLVQGWGDVPFRLESTKTVIGLDAERTDKQIIYDRIVADMEASIANLPEASELSYTELLTKSAARGILARVWLFRAGECYRDNQAPDEMFRQQCFEEAKKWALEVKDSHLHDLVRPYSRVFIDLSEDLYNNTGVRESIWEAAEAGNRSTTEQAAGRLGNTLGFGGPDYSSNANFKNLGGLANPGYSYKFAYASLKLYEMYESESDTARGDWNIANYEYTTGANGVTGRKFYYGKLRPDCIAPDGYVYTEETQTTSDNNKTRCAAKYRREYEKVLPKNKNYTPINFPILRYSDVLLMLAEAENEINPSPTLLAYECLNAVRTRAGLTELSGLDKTGFRNAIKKERAMELCFEGLRRWDLIRWGDFYVAMRDMESYVYKQGWGTNYTYAAAYYKVSPAYNYFPIPDTEIALNKKITANNPGW
ncbi:MAG: RagB/SusD family nutrient uptake outer membrane protein [Prevotella sp.]|jgi:hypothetical protein|nr:RagB/SusD family nutrient uptake outer membrane protein [Prevotella sp.]